MSERLSLSGALVQIRHWKYGNATLLSLNHYSLSSDENEGTISVNVDMKEAINF